MKSTQKYKILHNLDDALREDIRTSPVEMIEILMESREIINEALDERLYPHEEEKLCRFIRDKLIKWCYANEVLY